MTIHNCYLSRPLSHQDLNNVIHKLSSVVRMKYLWSTKVAEHMVLEMKGNFSSWFATKGEEYVDLGPVIHVVTYPLVRTIWPGMCQLGQSVQSKHTKDICRRLHS